MLGIAAWMVGTIGAAFGQWIFNDLRKEVDEGAFP